MMEFAVALDHKAKGVLRVAVLRGSLLRSEVLDRDPEGRRDLGTTAEAEVGEADRAALAAAADRHESAGLLGERQELRPFPDMRDRLRLRMHRHQGAELGPERH